MPMKSRILGSVTHTRRRAARVSSAGTPGARKGRMSVDAVIDSIDGSAERSTAGGEGSAAASPRAAGSDADVLRNDDVSDGTDASAGALASALDSRGSLGGVSRASAASRLRRVQRDRKPSGPVMTFGPWPDRAAP